MASNVVAATLARDTMGRLQPTGQCHIGRLPNELRLQILGHCLPAELKTMKQQSGLWAALTTPLLFGQVYVAPMRKTLKCFKNFTQNPNITPHIKHLIFHDSQFTKAMTNRATYFAALPTNCAWSQAEKVAGWKEYCKLYYDQQLILTTEEDLEVLLRGLASLANLKKVTVIGGPSRLPGSRWYFNNGPHAWDFASTGLPSSFWSYPTEVGYHEWDGRGFQRLIRALNVTHKRPVEIHIGNWQEGQNLQQLKMGLPLSSLNPTEATASTMLLGNARRLFQNLTILNIQIDLGSRFLGHQYYERDLKPLWQLLAYAGQVQRLSVGFTGTELPISFSHSVLSKHWSALNTFTLRRMEIHPDELHEFLRRHGNTLTDITLDQVGFDANADHKWRDFINHSQPLLGMHRADVGVYEWVDVQGRRVPVSRRWTRNNGINGWV